MSRFWRAALLIAVLVVGGSVVTGTVTGDDGGDRDGWGRWLERLLFNPRERTRRGAEVLERAVVPPAPATAAAPGDDPDATPSSPAAPPSPAAATGNADPDAAAGAVAPLDSALRLRGDPVAEYNAGTARLFADRADAAPLLERAAEKGPAELAARAAYNLGNARLAREDFAGAIEGYRQALRRDPSHADAKHNLELALRLLQQQQQQQQQQNQDQNQDQDDQQQQQNQQQQQGEQDEEQDGDPQRQEGDEDENEEQEQEQEGQGQEQEQEQQQGEHQEGPLPQFEDLPDMTAEEAAAILEAVENLEREARRQEALEAARKRGRGKKDW